MRFLISFGMTKKECHCEATKLPWQSHYCYSQFIMLSLRGNEVAVAIPLLTTTQKVITSLPKAGVVIAYLLTTLVRCLCFLKNQNYAGEYAIPHYVRNDTFCITMRVNMRPFVALLLGATTSLSAYN